MPAMTFAYVPSSRRCRDSHMTRGHFVPSGRTRRSGSGGSGFMAASCFSLQLFRSDSQGHFQIGDPAHALAVERKTRGIVTDIWSSVAHCSFELVFVGEHSGSPRRHSGVRTDVKTVCGGGLPRSRFTVLTPSILAKQPSPRQQIRPIFLLFYVATQPQLEHDAKLRGADTARLTLCLQPVRVVEKELSPLQPLTWVLATNFAKLVAKQRLYFIIMKGCYPRMCMFSEVGQ